MRHCLFSLSQILEFSALPENIFMFPLNIFPSLCAYRSLPSTQNFGRSVLEVASRDLIPAPVLERWQNGEEANCPNCASD